MSQDSGRGAAIRHKRSSSLNQRKLFDIGTTIESARAFAKVPAHEFDPTALTKTRRSNDDDGSRHLGEPLNAYPPVCPDQARGESPGQHPAMRRVRDSGATTETRPPRRQHRAGYAPHILMRSSRSMNATLNPTTAEVRRVAMQSTEDMVCAAEFDEHMADAIEATQAAGCDAFVTTTTTTTTTTTITATPRTATSRRRCHGRARTGDQAQVPHTSRVTTRPAQGKTLAELRADLETIEALVDNNQWQSALHSLSSGQLRV